LSCVDMIPLNSSYFGAPHHNSPLDEINEIRRNAADSPCGNSVTHLPLNRYYIVSP